jgi:hypothetical protein
VRFPAAVAVVVAVPLLLAGRAMSRALVAVVRAASEPSAVVVGSAGVGTNGCVVFSGGAVECWGYDGVGHLGTRVVPSTATVFNSTPVAVKGIGAAEAVSTDGEVACALLSGGSVKC